MYVRSTRNLVGYDAKCTEYTGGYTIEVLKKLGAELQLALLDTPQHNGVSEKSNLMLQKKVRSYSTCSTRNCLKIFGIWL